MSEIDVERAQQALREHDELVEQRRRETEERLYSTADVTVWAQEFCRTLAGKRIIDPTGTNAHADPDQHVDAGTMIGWFANYAQTINNLMHQQRIKDGVHPGTWHAFLHFYYLDCANASIHTGSPRFSPITFRLAEYIMSEHSVLFAINPDARLHDVFSALGQYREDLGREAEDSLDSAQTEA